MFPACCFSAARIFEISAFHRSSKADERSKGHPQVVVRAPAEIHLISNIEAETHRPDVSFDSSSGIEGRDDVVCPQIIDLAGKPRRVGRSGVEPRIDKSTLGGQKRLDTVPTEV